MLLLVLHTAVVKKKSLNTSFLIKYNEKVAVAENEEKNKAENKQTRAMIYLLTLPLPLSESTILNTKTFVHYLSKYF